MMMVMMMMLHGMQDFSDHGRLRNSRNGCRELDNSDVQCLKTLGALLDFELHFVALVQALVARTNDGLEVHEHIFAAFALDESETLRSIEPLNDARFHGTFLSKKDEQKIRSTNRETGDTGIQRDVCLETTQPHR
jgi:hypothetical protein